MQHSRGNRLPGAVNLAVQACITTFGELESVSVHIYTQLCWQGGKQRWGITTRQTIIIITCTCIVL